MRRTKRNNKQRGGFLFGDSNNTTYSNPTSYSNTYSSQPSGLDNVMSSIKSGWNSASQSVSNTYNSVTNSQPTYTSTYEDPNESWWSKTKRNVSGWFSGGTQRGRKKYKQLKGGNPVGYPDLSLATDVNGIKMAQPTYWIKGGKRSRKRVSKRRYRK